MRAFFRLFEFAMLFWVPFFVLIYFIKQWKWSVTKTIAWVITAAAIAGLLTCGVIGLIVWFD